MTGPQAAMLGHRLHLQHGPIDLIIDASGDNGEVRRAHRQAEVAFGSVLQTLVDELSELRRPIGNLFVDGPVAMRMIEATSSHDGFVTPMAAVAGSVADHILSVMCLGRTLSKVCVNNGGDIALYLSPEESVTLGIGDLRGQDVTLTPMIIRGESRIGGVATSGWRGRSHSLGIADYVTVFAKDAASADVAATLIANAVDAPWSNAVSRAPAEALSPDSDLGSRMVTTGVDQLSDEDVSAALASGVNRAETMCRRGLILGAFLGLQDQRRIIGDGVLHARNRLDREQPSIEKQVTGEVR